MNSLYARIVLSSKEVVSIQRVLDTIENEVHHGDDYGKDELIAIFTAQFENGYEADIKVCNGQPPYIDPVIFDENGAEIYPLETEGNLVGKYQFIVDDCEFVVEISIS